MLQTHYVSFDFGQDGHNLGWIQVDHGTCKCTSEFTLGDVINIQ